MSLSLFKLKASLTSPDPLLRKIEDLGFKYVQICEDINRITGTLIYPGITSLNNLIESVPDVSKSMVQLKRLHNQNYIIARNLLYDFYLMSIDSVNELSTNVDCMNQLAVIYDVLYRQNAVMYRDSAIIKYKVFDSNEYKHHVNIMLKAQYKFKSLSVKIQATLERLLLQLKNLLAIQKEFINIYKQQPGLMRYDNTLNIGHLNRLADNVNGYHNFFASFITDLHKKNKSLSAVTNEFEILEGKYRANHNIDPSFYISYNGIGNFANLTLEYQKLRRALDIEIANAGNELMSVAESERRHNQVYVPMLTRFSPQIMGLAGATAEARAVRMKNFEHINDFLITDIRQCLRTTGDQIRFCVDKLSGVQKKDIKKVQEYIDFVKLQQQASKDRIKYSKLLMALYRALADVIRHQEAQTVTSEEIEIQRRIVQQMQELMAAYSKIQDLGSGINDLHNYYTENVRIDESASKQRVNKNRELIISMQNQLARLTEYLNKLGPVGSGVSYSGLTGKYDSNDAYSKVSSAIRDLPDKVRAVADVAKDMPTRTLMNAATNTNDTDEYGQKQRLDNTIAQQYGGTVRHKVRDFRKTTGGYQDFNPLVFGQQQTGGAPISNLGTQMFRTNMFYGFVKVIDDAINREKERMLRADPSLTEVQRLNIELALAYMREKLVKEQFGDMANDGRLRKLLDQIDDEYVLNIIISQINQYKSLRHLIDRYILDFRNNERAARSLAFNAIRENASNSAEIQNVNNEIKELIVDMERNVDKIDDTCSRHTLNVNSILSNTDQTSRERMETSITICSNNITNILNSSAKVMRQIMKIMYAVDVYDREKAKERLDKIMQYPKYIQMNLRGLRDKAFVLYFEAMYGMVKYANIYSRTQMDFENLTEKGQKGLSQIKAMRLDNIQKEVINTTEHIKKLKDNLRVMYTKFASVNESIRELAKNNASETEVDRMGRLLKLKTMVTRRAGLMDQVNMLITEINNQLTNQRLLVEELARLDIKRTLMVFAKFNRVFVNHYATSRQINDRLNKLKFILDHFDQFLANGEAQGIVNLERQVTSVRNTIRSLYNTANGTWEKLREFVRPDTTISGGDGSMKKPSNGDDKIDDALEYFNTWFETVKSRADQAIKTIEGTGSDYVTDLTKDIRWEIQRVKAEAPKSATTDAAVQTAASEADTTAPLLDNETGYKPDDNQPSAPPAEEGRSRTNSVTSATAGPSLLTNRPNRSNSMPLSLQNNSTNVVGTTSDAADDEDEDVAAMLRAASAAGDAM